MLLYRLTFRVSEGFIIRTKDVREEGVISPATPPNILRQGLAGAWPEVDRRRTGIPAK